jgi:flavin reductase (DIM6/NTAB) family NADH-FMN oxidoreductase RutF
MKGNHLALDRLVYGVHIITLRSKEVINAFTASWVSQVSFEPPLIMVAVHREHFSHFLLERGDNFAVNILGEEQGELAKLFYTPVDSEKQERVGVLFTTGKSGAPILREAMAYLDCQLVASYDAGDHTIYLGQVIDSDVAREGNPLTTQQLGERYAGSRP